MPHRHADDPQMRLHLTTIAIVLMLLVAAVVMAAMWLFSQPSLSS